MSSTADPLKSLNKVYKTLIKLTKQIKREGGKGREEKLPILEIKEEMPLLQITTDPMIIKFTIRKNSELFMPINLTT